MSKEPTNTTRAIAETRTQLTRMEDQFIAALPKQIPVERFMRVVLTAVQNNPRLLNCSRKSLFGSAMKAAQDGLLPDGREAAFVEYSGEVQYQPMVAGIRKKARNSGEIATWDVYAVYENDKFEYALGDNPYIHHVPATKDRGEFLCVYSVCKLKDGSLSREVMFRDEIDEIRERSIAWKAFKAKKIKSTPWQTDYAEMAKKTVAKRHSKMLPSSTDLDDIIRHDDDVEYRDAATALPASENAPRTLADRMGALIGADDSADDEGNGTTITEDGEIIEGNADAAAEEVAGESSGDADTDGRRESETRSGKADKSPEQLAYDEGRAAYRRKMSRRAMPPKYRDDQELGDLWLSGYDAEKDADNGGDE